MQENAAALLDRGRVRSAVEEERLSRVRHHGFSPAGRPGVTITADPTICLEEAFCRRAAGELLAAEGLTLDDVDLLAVNGLPARYRKAYSAVDDGRPLPVLRSGRVVLVPHHLAHAASAWRVSGQRASWVLTIDGRGDRETAALFAASRGRLERRFELLSLADRSIGGVYETATRILGLGAHGQGSTMALAALGRPMLDLSGCLGRPEPGEYLVSESEAAARLARFARKDGAALGARHRDLAASLQTALEELVLGLLRDQGLRPGLAACFAGGVALNCRLNARLRDELRPRDIFVQPAANDAGTALGAALEAAALAGLPPAPRLGSALLGPGYPERELESALRHAGLAFRRPASLAGEAAGRLAAGQVLGWFQGKAEFGPRALGARSLLADPRRPEMRARLNRIKGREPWRPFGPSILAGHESGWFEGGFDSRFMLFTLPLKEGAARRVPAVAHADGTSRPQSVHRAAQPLYHELIRRFHERTGVPMVLNTSFNRRGEPIVCSPRDAVECFLAMPDVDALALGPFVAERARIGAIGGRRPPCGTGGRRLLLRLSAREASTGGHSLLADLAHLPDRPFDDALRALAEGRAAGCDELVVLREPGLYPRLADLLRRARELGYRRLQLQTDGRSLARGARALALVDAVEVTLLAADEKAHDAAAGAAGAFRGALALARAAGAAGKELLLDVVVLRPGLDRLARAAPLAAGLGAGRLTLAFPRPIETARGIEARWLPRLAEAAPHVNAALRRARESGLAASAEAFPACLLEPGLRPAAAGGPDPARARLDDLDRLADGLAGPRALSRPDAPACRGCRLAAGCGRTWALYLALFGSTELLPDGKG